MKFRWVILKLGLLVAKLERVIGILWGLFFLSLSTHETSQYRPTEHQVVAKRSITRQPTLIKRIQNEI